MTSFTATIVFDKWDRLPKVVSLTAPADIAKIQKKINLLTKQIVCFHEFGGYSLTIERFRTIQQQLQFQQDQERELSDLASDLRYLADVTKIKDYCAYYHRLVNKKFWQELEEKHSKKKAEILNIKQRWMKQGYYAHFSAIALINCYTLMQSQHSLVIRLKQKVSQYKQKNNDFTHYNCYVTQLEEAINNEKKQIQLASYQRIIECLTQQQFQNPGQHSYLDKQFKNLGIALPQAPKCPLIEEFPLACALKICSSNPTLMQSLDRYLKIPSLKNQNPQSFKLIHQAGHYQLVPRSISSFIPRTKYNFLAFFDKKNRLFRYSFFSRYQSFLVALTAINRLAKKTPTWDLIDTEWCYLLNTNHSLNDALNDVKTHLVPRWYHRKSTHFLTASISFLLEQKKIIFLRQLAYLEQLILQPAPLAWALPGVDSSLQIREQYGKLFDELKSDCKLLDEDQLLQQYKTIKKHFYYKTIPQKCRELLVNALENFDKNEVTQPSDFKLLLEQLSLKTALYPPAVKLLQRQSLPTITAALKHEIAETILFFQHKTVRIPNPIRLEQSIKLMAKLSEASNRQINCNISNFMCLQLLTEFERHCRSLNSKTFTIHQQQIKVFVEKVAVISVVLDASHKKRFNKLLSDIKEIISELERGNSPKTIQEILKTTCLQAEALDKAQYSSNVQLEQSKQARYEVLQFLETLKQNNQKQPQSFSPIAHRIIQ